MTAAVPNSSGTVGQTTISVQKLIDHGARRAGKLAETLTVEQVESARDSLFYVLSGWSSKGLNLWAANYYRFGIVPGQKTYVLPQGTVDLLNINYVTGNVAQTDYAGAATTTINVVTAGIAVATVGVVPAVDTVMTLTRDGQVALTFAAKANVWTYADVPVQLVGQVHVLTSSVSTTFQYINVVSNLSEIPMAPLNRDDYFNLPNKEFPSTRPLQYFFEKFITPQVTLWPVGSDAQVNVNTYLQYHIEDVGSLRGELAIPQRWYPAIQDALSVEMALELPGVDGGRVGLLQQKAQASLMVAEQGEADGMPIYWGPNISHYTR